MTDQSAVDFPGDFRIHIGLAVKDLQRSRAFYETLFGEPPIKERPGYVKFEPQDPSVNLSLNEVSGAKGANGPVGHYGVQVKTTQAVEDAIARFTAAGLETSVEDNTTCCYAVQDKVWVADPEGNQWEVFVVLEADAETRKDEASTCCATEDEQETASVCC